MQQDKKVAWLFPGQGSQVVGMGKELAASSEAARRVFERADAALGEPLSRLCFEGPIEELTLTANTQPALVAMSMAAVAALRERLPDLAPPVFAAGHSLGEYSALVAAGALALEDAVRLCRLRGAAMQDAVPPGEGAMAAIMGLDAAVVSAICDEAASGRGRVTCELQRARADRDRGTRRGRDARERARRRARRQGHPAQGERAVPLRAHAARRGRARACARASVARPVRVPRRRERRRAAEHRSGAA